MNFLAHLYLSGNDEEIMVGNVLADRIRGKKLNDFSEGIQKGILLHHAIDHFTDNHPVVEASKQRLRQEFGHYAPVIIDVFYDHFLAANWEKYSEMPLCKFAMKSYNALKKYRKLFPSGFQVALIYMRFRNLLVSYASFKGVQFALERMSGRAKNSTNLTAAVDELKKNYTQYQYDFEIFFPELVEFVKKY
ncbi:MAG: ACP phosphodiesterase [Bacteroidota bacterium]